MFLLGLTAITHHRSRWRPGAIGRAPVHSPRAPIRDQRRQGYRPLALHQEASVKSLDLTSADAPGVLAAAASCPPPFGPGCLSNFPRLVSEFELSVETR
jgi:hypothetical protein